MKTAKQDRLGQGKNTLLKASTLGLVSENFMFVSMNNLCHAIPFDRFLFVGLFRFVE